MEIKRKQKPVNLGKTGRKHGQEKVPVNLISINLEWKQILPFLNSFIRRYNFVAVRVNLYLEFLKPALRNFYQRVSYSLSNSSSTLDQTDFPVPLLRTFLWPSLSRAWAATLQDTARGCGWLLASPRAASAVLCTHRVLAQLWAFPSLPPCSSWLTSTPLLWEVRSEISRLAESPNVGPHVHSVLTCTLCARPRCSCWFPFTGQQWQDLQSLSERTWTCREEVRSPGT